MFIIGTEILTFCFQQSCSNFDFVPGMRHNISASSVT